MEIERKAMMNLNKMLTQSKAMAAKSADKLTKSASMLKEILGIPNKFASCIQYVTAANM
jgi:hypothetical protein